MQIHAAVWLIVFALLIGGVFLYLRGNMDPDVDPHHPDSHDHKRDRTFGLLALLVALGLAYWLYTREPKVHILFAE